MKTKNLFLTYLSHWQQRFDGLTATMTAVLLTFFSLEISNLLLLFLLVLLLPYLAILTQKYWYFLYALLRKSKTFQDQETKDDVREIKIDYSLFSILLATIVYVFLLKTFGLTENPIVIISLLILYPLILFADLLYQTIKLERLKRNKK